MRLIAVKQCPVSGRSGKIFFDAAQDAFFGTPGIWTYRVNQQTGHLWLDPRPADDEIGSIYANYYTHAADSANDGSLWARAVALSLHRSLGYPLPSPAGWRERIVARMPSVRAAAELEVMRISAEERGSLLDYGCGSGAFLKRMRSYGWHVAGIEPDVSSAARVADREKLAVFSSIREAAQACGPETFDVITMSHVIEHLPDPVRTIEELRTLLSKAGRLIVTTPNAKGMGARIFGKYWRGLEPPRHFNIFTAKSLCDALDAGGFNVQKIRTEVRLARGIWFMSWLAKEGGRELETTSRPARTALKVGGYAFQVLEAAAVVASPWLGEEIFCVATPRRAT